MFVLFELLFLVGVGWAVVRLVSHLKGQDAHRLGGQDQRGALPPNAWTGTPPQRSQTVDVHTRTDDPRFNAQAPPAPQQPPAKPTREQKINELRRQYVADEITVEQYEAELDKLMRE